MSALSSISFAVSLEELTVSTIVLAAAAAGSVEDSVFSSVVVVVIVSSISTALISVSFDYVVSA